MPASGGESGESGESEGGPDPGAGDGGRSGGGRDGDAAGGGRRDGAPADGGGSLGCEPAALAAARAIFAAMVEAESVLVVAEPTPDGDAMGAAIAVEHVARVALARAGRGEAGRVRAVSEHGCPARYRFLARADRVLPLAALDRRDFDLAIVVDGGAERMGALDPVFSAARRRVYVDHHRFGSQRSYDLRLADPTATSTTQLLWPFFDPRGLAVPLEVEVAEALYLGLIFDTGSFQYPSTQPFTHHLAARLMGTGLDFARVHERAMLVQPFAELIEQSRLVAGARLALGGRVVVATARPGELTASGGDYGRAIQQLGFVDGAEAAVVLHEREPGKFRVSLRSRGRVDMGKLARELDPGGGGHARAAGCELAGEVAEVAARVVAAIGARLDGVA